VVTLLDERKPIMFKIFKPIREVGPQEVVTALHEVLNGKSRQEHRKQANG
jgi:hypothetical protein